METNNATQQQIRRLEEEEKIESFCCGDADLDDFIVNEAPFYRVGHSGICPFAFD